MHRASSWSGSFLGALTSVLALAVLELGNAIANVPFVPFDLFEWLTRALPGGVLTRSIDAMISAISALGIHPIGVAAKLAEQGMALGGFIAGCAIAGAIATALGRRSRHRAIAIGLTAGATWLAIDVVARVELGRFTAVGTCAVAIVMLGWGAGLGELVGRRAALDAEPDQISARRRFVIVAVGGTLALAAGLFGISSLLRRTGRRLASLVRRPTPLELGATEGPAASPPSDVLARRIAPVPGTRPELTSNADFYRVDINLEPPHIDPVAWRLVVDGLVDHPLALSLAELRRLPSVSQVITLECISNPLGGDLIGTSLWTGVRLRDVLARAGVRDSAAAIDLTAADGFYESVALADADDPRTLLVYDMNREPLPERHGFPLRIYIPNRHGMKQPKWLTRLRASDRLGPGYWVDRGWSRTAIPHTTSVIDTVAGTAIGGIAYAGARGISRVEVQVDDAPWAPAELVAPPLGPLCWVLWRYAWPSRPGRHVFRVRAYDGTGALQAIRSEPPHPDGATGIHSVTG